MPPRIAVPVVRVAAAVLLACGAAGCMRADVTRVARYQPGAAPLHKAAPEDSTYTVRYATVGQRKMRTVHGSARVVERGQPLGFRTAEDGTLLAVAGDEEFPLDAPADQVRKCIWYSRRKEPRQFVKEVGRFAQGTA